MGAAPDEAHALKQMEHVWNAHGLIEYTGRGSWNGHKVRALEAVREALGGEVDSILDLGPGSLCPLTLWAYFPRVRRYTGVEGSATIMRDQVERFPERQFVLVKFSEWLQLSTPQPWQYQLTLALDMLYHIPEDDVHDAVLERLFQSSRAVILTYSPRVQEFGGKSVGQGGYAWFPRPYVGARIQKARNNGWRWVYGATFTGGPQAQQLVALVKER